MIWLTSFALALTLAALMLNFGFALLFRVFTKSTFIKKNYAFQPYVSVLMPCFNEGRHVFKTIESIMANDYPMDKVEVVAIDDCSSDNTYRWLRRAARKFPNVKIFKNRVNSGKHHTLSRALSRSSGEILICIDSDCIFDKRAIREMTACFVDETIGGVGGRVGVSNPRENILTQCQTYVYYYSYQIMKMSQNWARNVTCISGCMFALRRKHFEAIKKYVEKRNWFGIGVRDGEDRYMTHLLLLKGLKTYVDIDAQCWTAVPNNFRQLFMQQLRWRRGGLRNLFWVLRTFRAHLKVLHPLTTLSILIPSTFVFLKPVIYVYAALTPGWFIDKPLLLLAGFAVYVVLATLVNIYMYKHNPEQRINPLASAFVGIWFAADMLITILALATFDVGDWGTRGASAQKLPDRNQKPARN